MVQHIPKVVVALEDEGERPGVHGGEHLAQVRDGDRREGDAAVPDVLHVVPGIAELPGVVHLDGDLPVGQLLYPAGEEFGCVAHRVGRLMDGGVLERRRRECRHREDRQRKHHDDSKESFSHFASSLSGVSAPFCMSAPVA